MKQGGHPVLLPLTKLIFGYGTKSNGTVASIWLKMVFDDEAAAWVTLNPVTRCSSPFAKYRKER